MARRRFSGLLLGGAPAPRAEAPALSGPALCQRYPDVPGLCHMNPVAARSWIARARRDNRALEREIARQERAYAEGTLDPSTSPVAHDHGHGHGHGHGHWHSHGHAHSHDHAAASTGATAAAAPVGAGTAQGHG
ncbi:hypothetical protein [Pseudonocardia thermophila]|uniref:hypothetical protein n=1 Tax=Pseudonocardia thermophila TaxID=1848 RepID=UPI00248E43B3|nr:hypothetical protein [Pseudonocardia thermophila]